VGARRHWLRRLLLITQLLRLLDVLCSASPGHVSGSTPSFLAFSSKLARIESIASIWMASFEPTSRLTVGAMSPGGFAAACDKLASKDWRRFCSAAICLSLAAPAGGAAAEARLAADTLGAVGSR